MTAVLLARAKAFGGTEAVADVLRVAGSTRSPDYLLDIVNWVSYDEAVALWRAGARVTRHPQFARAVGEDAARRLNGSPVAALFRSLGSPESVYRQIATSSAKYSVVTRLETVAVGAGFAEITAVPVDGFPRDPDHCAWTCGLLTQPTVLFGLPPASVEHEECAAPPRGEILKHHRGFDEHEAGAYAEQILDSHPAALPESWLVVPVRSSRRDYGRLLALYDEGRRFFAEERELMEVYARYAASALDSATALTQARQRYGQSSALLELARTLAAALSDPRPEPIFIDADAGDPLLRELSAAIGAVASILVPLAAPDQFLGLLAVSVMDAPDRLDRSPDLLDRLSGVAAQATTALQNGRLVDQITHQALHENLLRVADAAMFESKRTRHPATAQLTRRR